MEALFGDEFAVCVEGGEAIGFQRYEWQLRDKETHQLNDCEKIFSASSIQSGGENFTPVCYPVGQRPCSHRGAPSGKELSS